MKQNNSKNNTAVPVIIHKKFSHVMYIIRTFILCCFIITGSILLVNFPMLKKPVPSLYISITMLISLLYIIFFKIIYYNKTRKKFVNYNINFDSKFCRWTSPGSSRAISWGKVLKVKMSLFSKIKITSEKKEFSIPLLIIKNKREILNFFFANKRQIHILRFTRFLFLKLFLPLLFAIFIISYVAVFSRAEQSSMRPAIYPGDWLVLDKISYGLHLNSFQFPFQNIIPEVKISKTLFKFRSLKRMDIIVFQNPNYNNPHYKNKQSRLFIKRIIAKGGDSFEFKNNSIYINGKKESFLKNQSTKVKKYYKKNYYLQNFVPEFVKKAGRVTLETFRNGLKTKGRVPRKTFLVLGDNRTYSKDSRDRSIGFIPQELIVGRLLYNFENSESRAKKN